MKKKNIEYLPKKGASFSKEKARQYGIRIKELTEINGGKLTTEKLLEDAQNNMSPLHDYFCWDDTEAATKYRMYQARQLIGSIIQKVIVSGKSQTVRSFFNVSDDKNKSEKVYVTLANVSKKENYRQELIGKITSNLEEATRLLYLFKNHV